MTETDKGNQDHLYLLQIAARVTAGLDILMDSASISVGLYLFSCVTEDRYMEDADLQKLGISAALDFGKYYNIVVLILYLVYMCTELIFGIMLLAGAGQRNLRFCELWMIFAMVNFLVKGVQFVCVFVFNEANFLTMGALMVEPIVRLGMFTVVSNFVKEVRRQKSERMPYSSSVIIGCGRDV